MYREIVTPESQEITLKIPVDYLHKRIEILVFELDEGKQKDRLTGLRKLFAQARERPIDRNIDVDAIINEMNDDLF